MKRFYKGMTVTPLSPGFGVLLDGKPVYTPGGSPLLLATRALAETVAREWAEATGEIHPFQMPLTRLALTQQDRVAPRRLEVVAKMLFYAQTDLLCYRSPEDAALAERQRSLWDPLLDWFEAHYRIRLIPTKGIIPIKQATADLTPLAQKLDALTDAALTSVALATPIAGSLVLGLALLAGRLTAEETLTLGQLDEIYQAERWGKDPDAIARQTELKQELEEIARFVSLNQGAEWGLSQT